MAEKADLEWLAARGVLASGVAGELAGPLEAVYDTLAAAVERLDRHVASARGPEPLPWHAVGEIRERVADAFLAVGRVRMLAAGLASLSSAPVRQAFDLNELAERALGLVRHRFAGDGDVLLDLATLPPVEVDPARLGQALALLLVHVADAARAATIVVRTEARPTTVLLRVEAPRDGVAEPLRFAEVIRAAVEADGGTLTVGSDAGALILEVALPRNDALR